MGLTEAVRRVRAPQDEAGVGPVVRVVRAPQGEARARRRRVTSSKLFVVREMVYALSIVGYRPSENQATAVRREDTVPR